MRAPGEPSDRLLRLMKHCASRGGEGTVGEEEVANAAAVRAVLVTRIARLPPRLVVNQHALAAFKQGHQKVMNTRAPAPAPAGSVPTGTG